jgi:hypothetical protein
MGAGVMVQSLLALRHGDTGFDRNNALTMQMRLVDARYPTSAQRLSFLDAASLRIRALPGVEAAGTIDDLPLTAGSAQTLYLEGYPPQRDPVAVQVRQITPGYLRAMRIPVLRGRDVVDSDAEVLLVSQDAAKLYWGEDDPIGRRAALPFSKTVLRQVVGIVGDVKQRSLIEASTPTVYFYTRQPSRRATFVMRTSVPPATLAQPAVAAIRAIDPEQPVEDIETMVQVLDGTLTTQRFSTVLLMVFAGVALVLAAVGIYSVPSYIIRGRSREIGIRTALGAQSTDILRLVIVEGMSPALAGIAVGTIAALASAKVMETLVFDMSASDPLTLAAVGGRASPSCVDGKPAARVPRATVPPSEGLARGVGSNTRPVGIDLDLASCIRSATKRRREHLPRNGWQAPSPDSGINSLRASWRGSLRLTHRHVGGCQAASPPREAGMLYSDAFRTCTSYPPDTRVRSAGCPARDRTSGCTRDSHPNGATRYNDPRSTR